MCGILAYFNRNGISGKELKQSLSALQKIKHRGPDGEGVVLINTKTGAFHNLITAETPDAGLENRINLNEAQALDYDLILGHRRLSIIDVSTNGHQPMHYINNNWIVFNGEIYNYIELREELKLAGFKFKTDSDTEVVHAAFQHWGVKCIEKFNGMFSIVLFDAKTKNIFVANDRFGVKPLYYINNENKYLFVSEIKQVKEFDFTLNLNYKAVEVYLKNHYLDYNEETFYKEIKRFKPSSYAIIDDIKSGNFTEISYYETGKFKPQLSGNVIHEFSSLFESAVKLRLRSDVPVGFASSGGLDSSAVLYTAHKLLSEKKENPDLSTFSAIFPGMQGDESEFIKLIESDLKIQSHYTNPLEEFNINDFENHIYQQDFPVQSTSYYAEWCVARLVNKQNVKVLLIGQGGDEILAGYHHHFYRYCRQLILKGRVLKYLSLAKKYADLKSIDVKDLHSKILNEVKLSLKFKIGLANLGNNLSNKWNRADKLVELLKMDLTEFTLPTYLRSDDRDGMAFGLETRHPFLDYRLVDYCFALPDEFKIKDGWQKWILREAMPSMPEAIRYRKDKKGYTTPQDIWINKNKAVFESYLSYIPDNIKEMPNRDTFLKYSLGAWFKTNQ